MPTHVVKQGEHLSRITKQYGFRNFETIWNDPNNAELKSKRANPNVLLPGDELFIPERMVKDVKRPTGKVHTFLINVKPLLLRIAVKDFDNLPVANADCELEVEGTIYKLRTDGDGKIEQAIMPTAETGFLRVPDLDLELPLAIGHLDPFDEAPGWEARLANLGYLYRQVGSVNEESLQLAIEEFQCDYSLTKTGQMDEATQAKLKELHGC